MISRSSVNTFPNLYSGNVEIKAPSRTCLLIYAQNKSSPVISVSTATNRLTVNGSLIVNGAATFTTIENVSISNAILTLAVNNNADLIDVGFVGKYVSSGTKYTGLVRASGGQWTLFNGHEMAITSINSIATANYATLNVGQIKAIGTVSAPGLSFVSNSAYGLYYDTATFFDAASSGNGVALSMNGTRKVKWTSVGQFLDGDLYVSGTLYGGNISQSGGGSSLVSIGVGIATPDAALMLDVTSTTKAFAPPRMTNTQQNAISSPPDGSMIYNSTNTSFSSRAGGVWNDMFQGGVQVYANVQSSGTVGGSATAGAWNTCTLNTALSGNLHGTITTLSSNQFTLARGRYYITATSTGYLAGRAKLRLNTGGTYFIGDSSYGTSSGGDGSTRSTLQVYLSITSSKTYSLELFVQYSNASRAFGLETNAVGISEVYNPITIIKIG